MKHTTIIKTLPLLFLSLHFSHLNASDHTARFNNESIATTASNKQFSPIEQRFTSTEQSELQSEPLSLPLERIKKYCYIQKRFKSDLLLPNPFGYDEETIYYSWILNILLSKESKPSAESISLPELASYADDICYSFTEPPTILFPLSTFIETFTNKFVNLDYIYNLLIQERTVPFSELAFSETSTNKLPNLKKFFKLAVIEASKINSIEQLEQLLASELDNYYIQHPCKKEIKYKFMPQYFKRAPLFSKTVFERSPSLKTESQETCYKTCYESMIWRIGERLENVFLSLDILKKDKNLNQKKFIDTVFSTVLSDIAPVEFTIIKGEFIKDMYKFNLKRDFLEARYIDREQFYKNMRVFLSSAEPIHDEEIFSLAEAVQRFYYVTKLYEKDLHKITVCDAFATADPDPLFK